MKTLLAFLILATAFTVRASLPAGLVTDLSSQDLGKRFAAQTALKRLAYDAGKPGADPVLAASLSKELLALGSDSAIPDDTRFSALEQLPFLADGSCVPGLAALLDDPKPAIRELARCALQNNPDPAASKPLVEALQKAEETPWVLGLMQALEARKESAAVPQLASRLQSKDPAVAALAAQSLGTIGGDLALEALVAFVPSCPPGNLALTQSAIVRCALPLTKEPEGVIAKVMATIDEWIGKPTAVESIATLWPAAANAAIRCEIFNALVAAGDEEGASKILSQVIAEPTSAGAREILHLAVLSGNSALKGIVIAALPGLDEDTRLAVHAAFAKAGDSSQEADLLLFVEGLEGQKRAAAIELLATCGTDKCLDFVVAELSANKRETLAASKLVLNRLNVSGLDDRLLEAAKGTDEAKAREAIAILAQRNPPGMEAFFLNLANPTAPAEGRQVALAALEAAGSSESAKQLLTWIAETPKGSDPKPYIAAFRRLAPRLGLANPLWNQTFLPLYKSATENREALLLAAPGIQGPASAQSYVDWIRSEPAMRAEYVAQLISWNSFENGEFLLAAARIPDIDPATREKLFQAATRLFFPNISAKPHKKSAFAKKVLAAAPEGPIRDSVTKAMADAKLP